MEKNEYPDEKKKKKPLSGEAIDGWCVCSTVRTEPKCGGNERGHKKTVSSPPPKGCTRN